VENVRAENLGERVTRSGNGDELDRLAVLFNAMQDRLADSFASIREFTLNASHELKTPLTILSGEIQAMLVDPRTQPEQREALAGQLEEVQRLARIVDDLGLLTKADAGLVRLSQAEISWEELVREVQADAEALALAKRIRVECSVCDGVTVTGDRDRLRQLLLNLVDNAVKYNVPDGRVRISLRRDGSSAEVRIANTGPGIPATSLPRVFDRFYRGENAMALQVEGSGLGLSLARWIAVSHGGELTLKSSPDGETEAMVRLPLSSPSTD
jgi:signal transduction histidine kinase